MKAKGGFEQTALIKRKNKLPNEGLMNVVRQLVPKEKNIIDIGAGIGQYVKQFRTEGYSSIGIDGSKNVEEITEGLVEFADISEPFSDSDTAFHKADWGFFIEVGEHVPKEFESVVIENVSRLATEGLIVSWAIPGQRGRGHVNCRMPEYITSVFALYGWIVAESETINARQQCIDGFKHKLLILKPINS